MFLLFPSITSFTFLHLECHVPLGTHMLGGYGEVVLAVYGCEAQEEKLKGG